MIVGFALAAWARYPAQGFVDSTTGRIRCHYQRAEDEAICQQVLVHAEEAWAAQVDRLGFRAPLPDGRGGGSDALDFYLTREAGGAGSAWVDCVGGDPACVDPNPNDVRDEAPAYVVLDPRTGSEWLRSYVHHEFSHVTQYATDFTEPYLALWEGTAVAAERWTDPDWSTSPDDLGDYQQTPWLSCILQDGYFLADIGVDDDSWYEYGAVAWMWFMDETYGAGDGTLGPRVWEEAGKPSATVLDAWEVIAGDREASLLTFAAQRARMGTDAGPAWAAFAGERAYARREETPMDAPAAPAFAPYPLGMVFYDASGPADLDFRGVPGARWALLAVTSAELIPLEPQDTVDLDEPWTLAVVNLGPDGFEAGDPLMPAPFTLQLGSAEKRAAEKRRRCGCASVGGSPAPWALLALLVARRRAGSPASMDSMD